MLIYANTFIQSYDMVTIINTQGTLEQHILKSRTQEMFCFMLSNTRTAYKFIQTYILHISKLWYGNILNAQGNTENHILKSQTQTQYNTLIIISLECNVDLSL